MLFARRRQIIRQPGRLPVASQPLQARPVQAEHDTTYYMLGDALHNLCLAADITDELG
jgi:hypothetical protein